MKGFAVFGLQPEENPVKGRGLVSPLPGMKVNAKACKKGMALARYSRARPNRPRRRGHKACRGARSREANPFRRGWPRTSPVPAVPSHIPTRSLQHRRDPAIAVTTILARQLDDRSRQRVFIVALGRDVSLRPSPLPQQPARTPLGKPMMLSGMLYRATSPFRA